MKTGATAVVALAAGIAGGVAAALVAEGGGAPPSVPAPARSGSEAAPVLPPTLARELEELRGRVDVAEASASRAALEVAAVRGELEEAKAALARVEEAARQRLDRAPTPEGELVPVAEHIAHAVEARLGGSTDLAERLRRVSDLRRRPVEERWASVKEALGLTATQVEELQAAVKERDEATRAAIQEARAARGDGGGRAVAVRPDRAKLEEARRRYDERVGQALTADQAKRWREDGHEDALRGGGGAVVLEVVGTPAESK
jgi:chromosome segregation ATPase